MGGAKSLGSADRRLLRRGDWLLGSRLGTSLAPRETAVTAAFTLIELMVVLVLIGVLSAMIVPEMKGSHGDALLRASGRELVSVFEMAYSRSVSLNQIHVVRFKEGTGRYALERRMPTRGKEPEFAPLKDVAGSSGKLDERIQVRVRASADKTSEGEQSERRGVDSRAVEAGQNGVVAFYPDGTADAAEVLLRDRAGFGLRLEVDPVTARIRVESVDRQQGE